MDYIGPVAEFFSVVSIIGHFAQYFMYNNKKSIMLGFLHGIKPTIESASQGSAIPPNTWALHVVQINDMISRFKS